jgi:hypothetical protein
MVYGLVDENVYVYVLLRYPCEFYENQPEF